MVDRLNNTRRVLQGGTTDVPDQVLRYREASVIDPNINAVTDRIIAVGATPFAVAVYPTNGDFYVANGGSGSVSVINPG